MKKSNKRLCFLSAIPFIAGFTAGFFTMAVFFILLQSSSNQREKEVKSFFYRTMHAIFEGTYESDEGSVSPKALKIIREYEPRLGKKCRLFLVDNSADYCEGISVFPSGDCLYVFIDRRGKRWVIKTVDIDNWERIWRDKLQRFGES